jgi:hypothetical protein
VTTDDPQAITAPTSTSLGADITNLNTASGSNTSKKARGGSRKLGDLMVATEAITARYELFEYK